MCGSTILHEVQLSTNDQWHISQQIGCCFPRALYNSALQACLEVGDVMEESRVSSHLPTYADCEYYGFHLS
jgi:hypothetical protein